MVFDSLLSTLGNVRWKQKTKLERSLIIIGQSEVASIWRLEVPAFAIGWIGRVRRSAG